jgi:hypothetical protein
MSRKDPPQDKNETVEPVRIIVALKVIKRKPTQGQPGRNTIDVQEIRTEPRGAITTAALLQALEGAKQLVLSKPF